jgi:post-segregation antitoxin (ccd killing protein)
VTQASSQVDTPRPVATISLQATGTETPKEATAMINIAVSSRSLAAARRVDPDVSPAAVHAAVEAAIAEHMREQRRRSLEPAEELNGPDA